MGKFESREVGVAGARWGDNIAVEMERGELGVGARSMVPPILASDLFFFLVCRWYVLVLFAARDLTRFASLL